MPIFRLPILLRSFPVDIRFVIQDNLSFINLPPGVSGLQPFLDIGYLSIFAAFYYRPKHRLNQDLTDETDFKSVPVDTFDLNMESISIDFSFWQVL